MSGLTDIFNKGLESTAKAVIADPIGTFSKKLDSNLSSAAQGFGSKLAGVLGYNLSDKVADAAKSTAAADRTKATDISKVVRPILETTAPAIVPILIVGALALYLWGSRR